LGGGGVVSRGLWEGLGGVGPWEWCVCGAGALIGVVVGFWRDCRFLSVPRWSGVLVVFGVPCLPGRQDSARLRFPLETRVWYFFL